MAPRRDSKKRPNGQGSVYQRKDKKWVAALTIGPRRRVTRIGRSKTEAQRLLAALLADQASGLLSEGSATPLADYLEAWLTTVKRPRVRPVTYMNMCSRMRRVVPHLGAIHLAKLTPAHLRRLYVTLEAELAPRSIAQIHTHLHDALGTAVADGILPANPADRVRPPRWEESDHTILSGPQLARLLETMRAADYRLTALFVVIGLTGMRHGEALALRWSDVDWTRNTITVQRTYYRVPGGGAAFGPTKTKAGRRTLRMTAPIVEALERHRFAQEAEIAQAARWADPELLFTTAEGRVLSQDTTREALYRFCAAAGVPRVTVHQLRHSMATMMGQQHVQPHTMQRQLGHARVQTTLSIYAHVLESMTDEAAQSVADVVKDG